MLLMIFLARCSLFAALPLLLLDAVVPPDYHILLPVTPLILPAVLTCSQKRLPALLSGRVFHDFI
jgi:hypothetical protein